MARPRKDEQPVRVPTGGPLGQAQQLRQAQSAIPLPQTPTGPPTGQPGGPPRAAGGQGGPLSLPDVFGPTQNPDEPLTAGAALGPGSGGMLPEDPAEFIRAVAMKYPSQGLLKLLERAARNNQ